MSRILVVDGDSQIRHVLKALFERIGHTVREADTAAQAMDVVARPVAEQPEAVVCDALMPGMSGVEFYERMIGVAPSLRERVVFVTGPSHDPAVHLPIEQLGAPLLGKLDDLQLVVDAVRLVLLRPKPA